MYICICNAVKESEYDRYHLIGNNCGKCLKWIEQGKIPGTDIPIRRKRKGRNKDNEKWRT